MADVSAARQAEVVLGEDWIGADAAAESQARAQRDKRGVIAMNRSPLARKIITFNLLAILVLVAGVLFLNPFRDSLVFQRERAIVSEAELIAGFLEAQLENVQQAADLGTARAQYEPLLQNVELTSPSSLFIYDAEGGLLGTADYAGQPEAFAALQPRERSTMITDALDSVWVWLRLGFGAGCIAIGCGDGQCNTC